MALAALPAHAQNFPTLIQAQGPVDYWRFNETNKSSVINTVSNLGSVGSSGMGFVLNGALTGEPGIVGNSVRLLNTGQNIGYATNSVDIPNVPALNPEPPFTIEFWTKPNAPLYPNDGTNSKGALIPDDTGMCIVSSMSPNPDQSSRSGYLFYIRSNSFTFRLGGENGYAATAVANMTIPTTSWSHVVGEFDGTNASIYVNGSLMGTGHVNNFFQINQWTPIRIGGTELDGDGYIFLGQYIFLFSGNRGYDGWFDEFAIYDTILSSNTIANHYKAGTTAPGTYDSLVQSSHPVGYWNFDVAAFTTGTNGVTLAADLGSLAEEGTNTYGTTAGQPGVPGLSSDSRSVQFSGEIGSTVLDTNNFSPTFTGTGEQITLAAWIKPSTLGIEYNGDIIAQGYDDVLSENYLRMGDTFDWEGIGDPDITYYEVGSAGAVFTGAGGYASAVFPVPSGDIGNWVFLVGTYDGTEWNLYRNGSLVATNGDGGIGPNQVEAPWSVGSRAVPVPYFGFNFPGSISEAAIFTNALDATTILDLYNSVHRPPVITQAPFAPPLYLGSSVDLSLWADGPGTLSYQWYSNNVLLAGQTQTNLPFDNLTPSNNATYAVVVSNAYGAVTSIVSVVVTNTMLPITLVPAAETRWIGSPISFSPSIAVSQPFTYQWYSNSTAIPGANSLTYTATATAASAGAYTLVYSNSFGVATSSVASVSVRTVPPGYASVIVADNPLSYFRLDETSGSTAFDYAGGNDGTYNGGCALGSPGALVQDSDTAVTFDGETNSFVGDIGATAINFSGTAPEFSIEAWAKGAAGEPDNAAVIAKGTGNAGENYATEQFAIDVLAGVYRFYANDTHGNTEAATAKTGPDGNWHHLVGVCNGNSGTLTLYIDGAVAGTAPIPNAGILSSTDPISIGAERSGIVGDYDWAYAGTIDEVGIYAYALSAQQVATHYGAAFGTDTLPFVKDQPVSVTNYVNLPVSVSVNSAGTVPLTYQWNKLTGPGTGPVSGATASTFSIANLALSDAGVYNCGITNSVGGIVSSNLTIVVLPPPTNPPSISGLVMHLTFDGNLSDATGRGNDATNEASGGATLITNNYVPGVIGEAFTYSTSVSGTNVMANYASIGVRPDLEFGSGDFSVSMWIQTPPNYIGNDLPFFCDVVGSTFGHPGFSFEPSFGTAEGGTAGWPGGWSYSVFDSTDTGAGYYGDKDQINDGSWHSLIYIIDHANAVSVYVDGVLARQNAPPGGGGGSIVGVGNINSANAATIGQDPTGQYPQDSKGNFSIDDLGVWNRAITPLEAAAIFTAGNINQLSFTAPVVSTITLSATNLHNGSLELTWSSGSLQSATNLTGPWMTLTNVTSPLTTNTSGLGRFFRATQ
jgi:hypothetical protein